MDCKCTFSQHMVGDGCEICNPAKSLEYAKDTIKDLEAELAALRRDAERYRWLRDNEDGKWGICVFDEDHDAAYYRDARNAGIVDAAIDAAMKESK